MSASNDIPHPPAHPDPHAVAAGAPHHHAVHETAPLHDSADEWHDHSKDEKPQHAHAEVGNAAVITLIGLALTGVIVFSVLATYLYYTYVSTSTLEDREIAKKSYFPPSLAARDEKQDMLITVRNKYTWVQLPPATQGDKPKDFVQIPQDKLIEKLAKEYAARK